MSNPLEFARVPRYRPSGFWLGMMMMIEWSRTSSTTGWSPYGVVTRSRSTWSMASVPSRSPPWMFASMKIGILTSVPKVASSACASAGSLVINSRTWVQRS